MVEAATPWDQQEYILKQKYLLPEKYSHNNITILTCYVILKWKMVYLTIYSPLFEFNRIFTSVLISCDQRCPAILLLLLQDPDNLYTFRKLQIICPTSDSEPWPATPQCFRSGYAWSLGLHCQSNRCPVRATNRCSPPDTGCLLIVSRKMLFPVTTVPC